MAFSGQGQLRACCLCMTGLIGLSAPAAAQAGAAARDTRSLEVRLRGSAVYDGNAARSGSAQAAARGLVREEMEFRPSIAASLVLPFDSHALFADADVGYEFHSRNKQLESERISAEGGMRLRLLGCTTEMAGRYARRLSELGDVYDEAPSNVEETRGVRAALRCARPVGIAPLVSGSYRQARNSLAVRKRSDVNDLSLSAGLAYHQPSVGRVSLVGTYTLARYPNRPLAGREDGLDSWQAALALERQAGTRLQGSFSLGYLWADPRLPGVPAFSGPSYAADIIWLAGPRLRGGFSAARTVEASNRLDISYFRQDRLRLYARYAATQRLTAEGRAQWRLRRFAPSSALPGGEPRGTDRSIDLGAGVSFVLNRRMTIGLDADWQRRDAAVGLFDYQGLRMGISASWRM